MPTLSTQFIQPYAPVGYVRGCLLYDPRGNSSPYLYSQVASSVYRANRRTGVIDYYTGQFDPQGGSFGPADMDENGKLWWLGDEPGNLTTARQAQTKFAADTLAKIGTMTSNGVTIVYPQAGQVRVDRHSSHHLVWQIDQGDAHAEHGNLYAWDGITRIQSYFLGRTTWDDQPVGGTRNRVWDFDSDSNGNLWCVTLDDNNLYILLWKVTPAGVQTMVTNLSTTFAGNIGIPMIRWVASDDSLVIGSASRFAKCRVSDGVVLGTAAAPIPIQYGFNYQSFHHTIDSDALYLCQTAGPVFYEINLLTLATARSIDFTGVPGVIGTFWNGFSQSYDAPRPFAPVTALYDSVFGGVWCEDFFQGVIGGFSFGDFLPPELTCYTSGVSGGHDIVTLDGANLDNVTSVIISPTNNPHDGNAFHAPIVSVASTQIVVSVPNSSIAQGYWFAYLANGTISNSMNTPCNPSAPAVVVTSTWKTRKVWFASLEP